MPRRTVIARSDDGSLRVEGLTELQRDIKRLDPATAKALGKRMRRIAKMVADDARARVPQVSGAAASSISHGATTRGAYVVGGKKQIAYYGWLDFGTREPIAGRPRSIGPWAGSGRGPERGRFIYAAIDANSDQIEDEAARALDEARREVQL